MIAMALACDPKLLIADEPTTALDVTIQAQILRLLDKIKAELGMGIILITHDMGVIAGRADRVVVMYAGQKIETAETLELFTHVRHPYTEALLASIPKLDQDRSQVLVLDPGAAARPAPSAARVPVRRAVRVRDRAVQDAGAEARPERRSQPRVRVLPPARSSAAEIGDRRRAARRSGVEQDARRGVRQGARAARDHDEETAALVASGGAGKPDIVLEFSRCRRSSLSPRAPCCAARSAPCTRSPTSSSRSAAARRSGSSASRAAARRRSDGSA